MVRFGRRVRRLLRRFSARAVGAVGTVAGVSNGDNLVTTLAQGETALLDHRLMSPTMMPQTVLIEFMEQKEGARLDRIDTKTSVRRDEETNELIEGGAGFDMAVIKRACEATGDECPPYRYACSLQVARRVYSLESYRLPFVAAEAGFASFAHHNATADALACAHVMVDAARRAGAADIVALAEATGVRVSQIAPATAGRAASAVVAA